VAVIIAKPNPHRPVDPAVVARLQTLRNTPNRNAAQNGEMLNLMYDLSIGIPGAPREHVQPIKT
jgi:hypothetical protein